MKKIMLSLIVVLFAVSSAFACQGYFCDTLQANAGINLEIDQSKAHWSTDYFSNPTSTTMGYQAIEAYGYATPGASTSFAGEALQTQNYDESFKEGLSDINLSGYSFMNTLASGEANPNCPVDFKSYAGQYSMSTATANDLGSTSSMDLMQNVSVHGAGKNLSFHGLYEQGNRTFTESPNGFSYSNGYTQIKINK